MLETLATIFIIIAIGLLARHFKIAGEAEYKLLNNVIYNVTLPILLFMSLVGAGSMAFRDFPLIAANALGILLMLALIILLCTILRLSRKLTALLLLAAFGNIVYMGYPVVELAFGNAAIPVLVVVVTVSNILLYSLGLALLQYFSVDGKINMRHISDHLLKNPLLIGTFAGLLFLATNLSLPGYLASALDSVGHITAPLALFSLGIFMYGRNPLANLKLNLAIAGLKMAAFPLLFILIAKSLGLSGLDYSVSLVETAMPLAVVNFILATQYKLDADIVSSAIVLTTLLSPIALYFFGSI
jgi:hypothetical protein